MDEKKFGRTNFLADKFEASRAHLRAVAYLPTSEVGAMADAERIDAFDVEMLDRN